MSEPSDDPTSQRVPRSLRVDYTHGQPLDAEDMAPDPISQFRRWFDQAIAGNVPEPNAMSLATVAAGGAPSVRIVLLKEFGAGGLTFYTNYASQKAHDLDGNPQAAVVFYWQPQERQVRVQGEVEKVSTQESESYFRTRPLEAQIGAWASHQSEPLASREQLEAQIEAVRRRFAGQSVPLPPFWGGYRLVPRAVEFWQGRHGRLHDRLVYRRQGEGWLLERLSP